MGLLWYHFVFTGNERRGDYEKAQVLLRKLMLGPCVSQPQDARDRIDLN